MSLPNLQAEFAEAILLPPAASDAVSPIQHLRIYQHTILSHLIQALVDHYPLLTQLLGEDCFRAAANEYIKHYPSTSGNLQDYGEYFSVFLAEYSPAKHLPYLPEVARFEWERHRISFAADPAELNFSLLQKISPDQHHQLHLVLHPASCLMQCHYPILQIIDLCQDNKDSMYLLMIRREMSIALVSLSFSDYIFLSALYDNQSLAEALKAALHADANFQLNEKLSAWVQDKTIVDCYLSI
ncbi:MAG: DUF2063 domain-containing protein [Gammaproteobacteria bacterium]|nr:MAG: DUF2063 domain-containing protein [Gammaproteobacteria bacterium]